MEETPTYVVITKTCVGSLTLTVTNPVSGVISRIQLRADEPKRMVPLATAALIYTDMYSGAYRMYKEGYFSFDNPELVYKYAYDHGMIIGDPDIVQQKTNSSYMETLKKALISGNKFELDKYFETTKGAADVVHVARGILGSLRQSTVQYIETKAKTSLTVDGEEIK